MYGWWGCGTLASVGRWNRRPGATASGAQSAVDGDAVGVGRPRVRAQRRPRRCGRVRNGAAYSVRSVLTGGQPTCAAAWRLGRAARGPAARARHAWAEAARRTPHEGAARARPHRCARHASSYSAARPAPPPHHARQGRRGRRQNENKREQVSSASRPRSLATAVRQAAGGNGGKGRRWPPGGHPPVHGVAGRRCACRRCQAAPSTRGRPPLRRARSGDGRRQRSGHSRHSGPARANVNAVAAVLWGCGHGRVDRAADGIGIS